MNEITNIFKRGKEDDNEDLEAFKRIIKDGKYKDMINNEIYNLIIARLINTSRASDIYKKIGFK